MWLLVFSVDLTIIVRCWKRPVASGGVRSWYSVDHSGLGDYWM